MSINLAELRQDYSKAILDIDSVDANPIVQFNTWFREALHAEIKEPNAMILSTSVPHGGVDARTVLLKDLPDDGFVFYTNYMSDKASQLIEHPDCHLLFLWLDLERQVRIKGKAHKVSRDLSTEYFNSRPRESRIGAWASPQSSEIPDRAYLESKVEMFTNRFLESEQIPTPDFWGGYKVIPHEMEFWQGRRSRLHDRLVYKQSGSLWRLHRLAP